jgi:hypothetical protein
VCSSLRNRKCHKLWKPPKYCGLLPPGHCHKNSTRNTWEERKKPHCRKLNAALVALIKKYEFISLRTHRGHCGSYTLSEGTLLGLKVPSLCCWLSDKNRIKMNVNVRGWWNYTNMGKQNLEIDIHLSYPKFFNFCLPANTKRVHFKVHLLNIVQVSSYSY